MENKDAMIMFWSAVAGSLIALVIFSVVAIIAGVPLMDALVMHETETITNEFNNSVIECGAAYRQSSMQINLNGKLFYCTLNKRMPGAPLSLDNNFGVQN